MALPKSRAIELLKAARPYPLNPSKLVVFSKGNQDSGVIQSHFFDRKELETLAGMTWEGAHSSSVTRKGSK